MKKLILIALLPLLFSCSKEEDVKPEDKTSAYVYRPSPRPESDTLKIERKNNRHTELN